MQITANEAVKLAAEEGVKLGKLEEMGFEIVVGGANASAPAPEPVAVNDELVAHIEALRKAGRSRTKDGSTFKTKDGRPKVVLGKSENIGGYTVIINGSPSKK